VTHRVSASTQNQALSAVLFLYRDVLRIDLGELDAVRAHRTRRLPVVLSREEVAALLAAIDAVETREPYPVLFRLMYGAGLRLFESCSIRVKDVDLQRNQITIRQAKGDKDRQVMLPSAVREAVAERLKWREALHRRDLAAGQGWIGSTRTRRGRSAGSSCSPRASCPSIRAPATRGGITSTTGRSLG
jgi:site-specific recombinase XerD